MSLAASMLSGCDSPRPAEPPPVMPEAVPARVPGDISSERLSLVVDEVQEALKPRFGVLDPATFRVPAGLGWPAIERFYGAALAGRMEPVKDVYREGRRHRLGVWSANGRPGQDMLAVAYVETPVSGQVPGHGVLVLLTPRRP
jgi:hypothetical protein